MRRLIVTSVLAGGTVLAGGCHGPWGGGLWSRPASSPASAAMPAGNQQRFGGLTHDGAGGAGNVALGGPRPAPSENFLLASWKKTTAAMTGGSTAPRSTLAEDDPLRLDRMPRKIGPEVYVGAARLLENQGKFDEAEAKYREALKVAPHDFAALIGLARLYDRQGQGAKALETYRTAAKAHPDNALVFNDLGLCYRRQRQTGPALEAFRRAIALKPEEAKYRNNLAAALVEAGQPDEALEQLLAVHSPATAHYNLACLLQQHGDATAAATHLQQALRHDPGLAPARQMLAQLGSRPFAVVEPAPSVPQQASKSAAGPQTAVSPAPHVGGAELQSSHRALNDYAAAADETPELTSPVLVSPWEAAARSGGDLPSQVDSIAVAQGGSEVFSERGADRPAPPRVSPEAVQIASPLPLPAQRPPPPSYHIGDEGPPSVGTTHPLPYSSAAWVFPAASAPSAGAGLTPPQASPRSAGRPLPPID